MLRTASKISTVDQHATPRVGEIRPSHKLDDYLPQCGPQRPRGAGRPLPGVTTGCARPSASTSRRSSTCSTRGAGSSTSSTASRRTTSRPATRRSHRHRRRRRRALAPPRPRPLGPLGLCAARATSCCGLHSCVCVCVRVSLSLAAVGVCLSCLSTCELVTVCLSLSSSHLAIGQHCTNSDRPSQWLPTGSPGEPPPQKQGLGGVRGGLALEGPPRELQPLLPGSAFY